MLWQLASRTSEWKIPKVVNENGGTQSLLAAAVESAANVGNLYEVRAHILRPVVLVSVKVRVASVRAC